MNPADYTGQGLVWRRARDLLRQKESITGTKWLEKHIWLDDPKKHLEGRVDFSRYPMIKEIVDYGCDPMSEMLVLCCSTQSLKSTALKLIMGYRIANNAGPKGWVMDSGDAAKDFSIARWQDFVKQNAALAARMPADPNKFGNLVQHFIGAPLYFLGSNSPGKLASRPLVDVFADEVDKWPTQATREAGALDNLLERLQGGGGFAAVSSTPTYEDLPIWREFGKRDQRHYFLPCPHCGEPYKLERDLLQWDQGARMKDGAWNLDRVEETAHIACPHCGGPLWNSEKKSLIAAGQWLPTAEPKLPGRSYRYNRLYSVFPHHSFGKVARFMLAGKGDLSKHQVFLNSWMAEPMEEETDSANFLPLERRQNDYNPLEKLPEEVLVVTAGADVQAGEVNNPLKPPRIEVTAWGFGLGIEAWTLIHHVIPAERGKGEGSLMDLGSTGPWAKLDRFLENRFPHPKAKRGLGISCTLIDSGHLTSTVYKYTERRQFRRIFAAKGKTPGQRTDEVVKLGGKNARTQAPLYLVSRYAGNTYIYGALSVEEPGPVFIHFPLDPALRLGSEFFEQLTSEKLKRRRLGGRMVERWDDEGRASEALACARNAYGALMVLNPDWESLKRRFQMELDLAEGAPAPAAEAPGPSAEWWRASEPD